MHIGTRNYLLGLCVVSVLSWTAAAGAASLSGVTYCGVSGAVAGNTPTLATLSAAEATGTQCANFSATSIDFSAEAPHGGYSLGGFLTGYGAAFNITYQPGFSASSSLNNTLFVFTGTASFTNGSTFTVTHDDGTNMYVNGSNVLSVPGPTSPVSTPYTYTGPSGTYNFEFLYTECCGGSADYITSLIPAVVPSAVPEPGTLLMFGTGLLGVGRIVQSRIRR